MTGMKDSQETGLDVLLTKETILFLCPLFLTGAFSSLPVSSAGEDRLPMLSIASGSEL